MKIVKYSLVSPVFKNESNIESLFSVLHGLNTSLNEELEVVFVIDGSPDRSLDMITQKVAAANFRFRVIELSRNFGSFAAIDVGIKEARGQYFAVMSADLQEPPELVLQIFNSLEHKDFDVAIGTRISRGDSRVNRFMSAAYWRIYRSLINKEIPSGGVDIFGINKRVQSSLSKMNEANSSLIGLLFWIGFRRVEIPYVRSARLDGKSAWTMRKKIKYLSNSIFSFTSLPITFLLVFGAIGTLISLLVALYTVFGYFASQTSVEGYTTLAILILLTWTSSLLGIGIVGTYVWRTFENSKNRPNAIIKSILEE